MKNEGSPLEKGGGLERKIAEIQEQLLSLSLRSEEMGRSLQELTRQVYEQKHTSPSAKLMDELIKAQIGTCNSLASILSIVNAHEKVIKHLNASGQGLNVCVMGQKKQEAEFE